MASTPESPQIAPTPPLPNHAAATPSPLGDTDRIASLDVLRGVAVLGILAMNIQCFAMIFEAYENPTAYGDLTGANYVVWYLSHLLFDGKFITIFSMLFGAGIVLMTERLEAKRSSCVSDAEETARAQACGLGGFSVAWLHYRRMGWLLAIGLVHAYALWYGDILYAYAICGMILYWFRGLPPRALLSLGIIALLVPVMIVVALQFVLPYIPDNAMVEIVKEWSPPPDRIAEQVAAYRGGWQDQMRHRVPMALAMQTVMLVLGMGFYCGGLMLIGVAMYRWSVFAATRSTGFYAAMIIVGVGVGIPVTVFGVRQNEAAGWSVDYSMFIGCLYDYFAAPLVSLAWIGLVMLVCKHGLLRPARAALSAVGRTALTNYLMHTVICTTIFYGHGFGLFGYVSRLEQVGVVVAIWICQLVVSPLWLRRYRFGPFEWAWRSLTYRQLQPMRVAVRA